jgi:hypothetical protein
MLRMENRKKLGAILIGVVLALQTAGCGKTEPAAVRRTIFLPLRKRVRAVWELKGILLEKYPMKTCNKVK